MNALECLSPLDGRYCRETMMLRDFFSEKALMKFRVQVEVEWLIFMGTHAVLPDLSLSEKETSLLKTLYTDFSLEQAEHIKTIERQTNHDVKAIEYFLRDHPRLAATGTRYHPFWHFGCTSEDINNLAYALMLKGALHQIILPELTSLQAFIQEKALAYCALPMLSRTHGQAATPTTVGKELGNIAYRLSRQLTLLQQQEILGKFHGAVGHFNAHLIAAPQHDWPRLAQDFVETLGLTWNPMVTQIEPHDFIAELSHHLSLINTILIDFSRDLWTYISLDYFTLQVQAEEIGSSTMPHKVNPIDFENAEGNAGLANALFGHFAAKLPISRLQRDLSDSTVLRNLGCALGYALLTYRSLRKGLGKITPHEAVLKRDLSPRFEVLTEAIQTVLRYHGIEDAYEQLKSVSRGQVFDEAAYHNFIQSLPIPPATKARLATLTPTQYIGLAAKITQQALRS